MYTVKVMQTNVDLSKKFSCRQTPKPKLGVMPYSEIKQIISEMFVVLVRLLLGVAGWERHWMRGERVIQEKPTFWAHMLLPFIFLAVSHQPHVVKIYCFFEKM